MPDTLRSLLQWFTQPAVALTVSIGSLLLLIGTLVLAPRTIARLPPDYLIRKSARTSRSPVQWLLTLGRNVLALILLLAGIAMLLLPGQGVLTLLVGVLLLDVPGKRRLLRRILVRPRVRAAVDRLRQRKGQPPLLFDPPSA